MVLNTIIEGRSRRIELEPLSGGSFRVSLDGVPCTADVEVLPGNVYSLVIDGVHFAVEIDADEDGFEVGVRGHRYPVEVVDPRRAMGRAQTGGASGPAILKSPMPGKVIKLLAAEGAEVAAGAGIIVVEAMKMQNELKAPRAGRISKLFVAEGANVESGAKLLVIE